MQPQMPLQQRRNQPPLALQHGNQLLKPVDMRTVPAQHPVQCPDMRLPLPEEHAQPLHFPPLLAQRLPLLLQRAGLPLQRARLFPCAADGLPLQDQLVRQRAVARGQFGVEPLQVRVPRREARHLLV